MASGPLAETRLTTPPVNLRPSVTLFSQPLPDEYIYLSRPVPRSHATIRFLHPAYDAEDNEFLELNAWDAEAGGLHYGLAHTACAIVANNRFDGYFSNERTPGRQVVGAVWNQILPFNREGYYFHVPESKWTQLLANTVACDRYLLRRAKLTIPVQQMPRLCERQIPTANPLRTPNLINGPLFLGFEIGNFLANSHPSGRNWQINRYCGPQYLNLVLPRQFTRGI